jgi:trimeric autotransporter adhesin
MKTVPSYVGCLSLLAFSTFGPNQLNAQTAPSATTLAASNVVAAAMNTSATLWGAVNPAGADTLAWFQWGQSSRYGSDTVPAGVGNGTSAVTVSASLMNLVSGQMYHFRLAASNAPGTAQGADQMFWAPAVVLNGPNPMILELHAPFADPGATVMGSPRGLAANSAHSFALKADGNIAGWGDNTYGERTIPGNATNAIAIAAGVTHTLALKGDGTVAGWGYSGYGQTNSPADATNVVAIAAGNNTSYALRSNGTVMAWGDSSYGKRTIPANATNVTAIAASYETVLALKADGTVVSWGYNGYNQTNIPPGATNVTAVAANTCSLVLRADGTVLGWGYNQYGGATGVPNPTSPYASTGVVMVAGQTLTGVAAIAAGGGHSLALKTNGTVVGWGRSTYGEINIPAGVTNIVAIAAGSAHSLALRADGTVLCWGYGSSGQTNSPAGLSTLNIPIGVSGSVNVDVPGTYVLTYTATNSAGAAGAITRTVRVGAPRATTLPASGVSSAGASAGATLNGTVNPGGLDTTAWFKWGASIAYGSHTTPASIGNGEDTVPVSAGLTLTAGLTCHYCAAASNSVAAVQGSDRLVWAPAMLLNGSDPLSQPLHVSFVDPGVTVTASPLAIAAGGSHSLALKADGTVIGWGDSTYGQTNSPSAATNVTAIAAGSSHSLALRGDGTVVAWGRGNYGQTNVPADATNLVMIAAGGNHCLGLNTNGIPIGWGRDNYGQATIPAAATNVTAIAAGLEHSLALRSDGTVTGWGLNNSGQTTIPAAATNVTAIAAGYSHNLALRVDGMVVAWGDSTLGRTTVPARATNVMAIAAGGSHSLALRADGTIVAWGDTTYNQTNVPVDATNIVAISAGQYHSLALRADGVILAWGGGFSGQTVVPNGLGSLTLPVTTNGAVNVDVPGAYLLTYSVTNSAGAVATAMRTVLVGIAGATTLPASNIFTIGTNTWATLNGTVNPFGSGATGWFEWGRSVRYGNHTAPISAGNGNTAVAMTAGLTNLSPGIFYHYRMVASNSVGLARGADAVAWSPAIVLNGPDPLYHESHTSFVDPGAVVKVSPVAIAAGGAHNLTLSFDGHVFGWGAGTTNAWSWPDYGQALSPADATNVVAIAAGELHSLALRSNHTVVAWGDSFYYQTTIPASASNVVSVAAGGSRCLALRADGKVVGWGYNRYGEATGVATPDSPYATNGVVVVAGQLLTDVTAIAAGYYHSLALKGDGTVVGWGKNSDGQCTAHSGVTNILALAAGGAHSLALRTDGAVLSWGDNSAGQNDIPAAATNVVAVAAGGGHNLALRSDGMVVGWGLNDRGQSAVPADATNIIAVAASGSHSLALRDDGVIIAWGYNGGGLNDVPATVGSLSLPVTVSGTVNVDVLGNYVLTYTTTNAAGATATVTRVVRVADAPVAVTLPATGISSVDANTSATLNGTADPNGESSVAWFQWGSSIAYGGNTTPTNVGSGTLPVAINASLTNLTPGVIYHCRLVVSNSVKIAQGVDRVFWSPAIVFNGSNPFALELHTPFVDPGATASASPLAIAAGGSHSLALKANGTVVSWGYNLYGQTNTPAGATNVVAIAAGYDHSLALKADGTVIGWGNNASGQTNIPAGATNVVSIAAGSSHSLALRADGTVVGWGQDADGQATCPASATNVAALAAGALHSLALRADGSLVGWGNNVDGQLTVPPAATNIAAIAAGYAHNLALRRDGTILGWGYDYYGEATGIPSDYFWFTSTGLVSVAGQTITNAVATGARGAHSLALLADGTVAVWGAAGSGLTNIPPGATNVVAVAAGGGHNLALRSDGVIVGWGWNYSGEADNPPGLTSLNLPVTVSGSVNTNLPGIYLLTYRATNAAGVSCTFTRTVAVVTRPVITGLNRIGNGTIQFMFTNTPGAPFHVRASTNLSLPLSGWPIIGPATEDPPGQFNFTDPDAVNFERRFYRVCAP